MLPQHPYTPTISNNKDVVEQQQPQEGAERGEGEGKEAAVEGEENTIGRQAFLKAKYNFTCTCPVCVPVCVPVSTSDEGNVVEEGREEEERGEEAVGPGGAVTAASDNSSNTPKDKTGGPTVNEEVFQSLVQSSQTFDR